jgi:hypothetical protein
MSIKIDGKEYKSGREALKNYAEELIEGSNIRVVVDKEELNYGGKDFSYELNNGKYMSLCYSLSQIQKFFEQINKEIIVDKNIQIINNGSKRSIPSSNKSIIIDEIDYNNELVGQSLGHNCNGYHIHHIIPFSCKDDKGFDNIHNPDNLVALNHNNHHAIHNSVDIDDVIAILYEIFKAYPNKHNFIKSLGFNMVDIAEMSMGCSK